MRADTQRCVGGLHIAYLKIALSQKRVYIYYGFFLEGDGSGRQSPSENRCVSCNVVVAVAIHQMMFSSSAF